MVSLALSVVDASASSADLLDHKLVLVDAIHDAVCLVRGRLFSGTLIETKYLWHVIKWEEGLHMLDQL